MLAGIALGYVGGGEYLRAPLALLNISGLALLQQLGNLGLIAFVYSLGIGITFSDLQHDWRTRPFWYLTCGSLVVPACAGAWFAHALVDSQGAPAMHMAVFAIVFSTTAVPVLGSVMRSLNLLSRYRIALSVAIFGDALLWPAMGMLIAGSVHFALAGIAGLAILLAAVAATHARADELVSRIAPRAGGALLCCAALALCGAWATEWLGLHAVLGAFLAGSATPRVLVARVGHAIERLGGVMVFPFFIVPGLMLGSGVEWADALAAGLLYTLCAGVAKIAGVAACARASGLSLERSLTCAFLLNTRGTVELVVATALFNSGLLTATQFGGVVIMAILCTLMAAPGVRLVERLNASASRRECVRANDR